MKENPTPAAAALHHDRYRCVNRRLVAWMGTAIAVSSLAGALASRQVANDTLMALFAALALVAAVLMFLPKEEKGIAFEPDDIPVNLPLAVLIAFVIGFLGGMVGQGGSFILIPLMLCVLALPTRVVIGSNLAVVFLSSLAGFLGKLYAGQIPALPAVLLVVGAVPGAQIGSVLSHRTNPRWLRAVLAAVVALSAVGVALDAFVR